MDNSKFQKQKGFTLIELMISMFIGLVVFGGVFTTFRSQKMLYSRQEKIIKINQDTRSALGLMKEYIRRAGISVLDCSPTRENQKCTGLVALFPNGFVVSSDLDLSGGVNITNSFESSETTTFILSSTFREGTATSLYLCPTQGSEEPTCSFILDNVSKFEIKACYKYIKDDGRSLNCYDSISPNDYDLIDSLEVTIQAETEDIEITENNQHLQGDEITARMFFINKAFQ